MQFPIAKILTLSVRHIVTLAWNDELAVFFIQSFQVSSPDCTLYAALNHVITVIGMAVFHVICGIRIHAYEICNSNTVIM